MIFEEPDFSIKTPAERETAYQQVLAEQPATVEQARKFMRRLTPLDPEQDGHADAHVWVAKDLFDGEAPNKTNLEDLSTNPGELENEEPRVAPKAEDLQLAAEHLKRAVLISQDHLEAHQLLAMYHLSRGQKDNAVALLEKAMTRLPDLGLILAGVHEQSGATDAASELARKSALHFRELALSDARNPEPRLSWARAEMLQNQDETAIAIIDRGQELFPDDKRFHGQRLTMHTRKFRRFLRQETPDYTKCFTELERLVELAPDNPAVIREIGVLTLMPKPRQRAREMLVRLAEPETTPAMAFKLLGDIAAAVDSDIAKGRSYYEEALRRNPEFIGVKNNLAWCLANQKQPELERALLLVDEAIAGFKKRSPQGFHPNYLETRGQILVSMGRLEEGVTDLEQALRFMKEGSRKKVHRALAAAYSKLGNGQHTHTLEPTGAHKELAA